jgi:hemoglobin
MSEVAGFEGIEVIASGWFCVIADIIPESNVLNGSRERKEVKLESILMTEPFDQFGEEGFIALVAAFYRRLRVDDIVGALYPKDRDRLELAERRLSDFLISRFGGSNRYSEERGHPRLGMRHSWMSIGLVERDRWLEMMTAAMDEVGLTGPARQRLDQFFTDTADALVNEDETEDKPFFSSGKQLARKPFDDGDDAEL